jgi:hypothetical protein
MICPPFESDSSASRVRPEASITIFCAMAKVCAVATGLASKLAPNRGTPTQATRV